MNKDQREIQTVPRGVLTSVPFNHHHLLLPLHSVAAILGAGCICCAQNAGVTL
ncbi:hypothetical protein N9M73_00055 [Rhodobacteraceae bacterium]|nr:hypothetical protein [Paracoccaceae bacterium]